jgi:hypothetical protein
MLTRLVVVIIFENFSFALFTPPPSRRLSPGPARSESRAGLGLAVWPALQARAQHG